MNGLLWGTPEEIIQKLAKRITQIRKRKKISQLQLNKMSSVSYGSIKRFETTGQISLIYLTQIAIALDYHELMKLVKILTNNNYDDILEMFRRMCI